MRTVVAASLAAAALCLPTIARATPYAPIDCAKPGSAAERAVCKTYALGQAEARMATLYGVVMSLVAMGQRGDLGDQQIAWLKRRDACGANTACLMRAYQQRIAQLNKAMDAVAAGGPY